MIWAVTSFVTTLILSSPGFEVERSARRCPAIFGTVQAQKINRKSRMKRLLQVEQGPYATNLLYTAAWSTEPTALHIEGASLIEIRAGVTANVAVLELDDNTVCARGRYLLSTDDRLGEHAVILAVTTDAVLLEVDGVLRYLAREEAHPPEFRMIWRAPFRMPHPTVHHGQPSTPVATQPSARRPR